MAKMSYQLPAGNIRVKKQSPHTRKAPYQLAGLGTTFRLQRYLRPVSWGVDKARVGRFAYPPKRVTAAAASLTAEVELLQQQRQWQPLSWTISLNKSVAANAR